jgi:addiction module RelE/StbE family toxin
MAPQTNQIKVKFSKEFIVHYKKADVRIQHQFDERILIFKRNPQYLQLHNHSLRDDWKGYRSINITADWRAIYKEISEETETTLAYFIALGTHEQLYGK